VIDDSNVWKDRLRRERTALKRSLRRSLHDPDQVESALAAIEVFAFLVGYIVRKLIESKKLSDELEGATMEVVAHKRREPDSKLDFLNAHHVERAYDLSAAHKKNLGLRQLCNLLVHSFVFMPAIDQKEVCAGFYVNSDQTKERELVFVDWADFDLLVSEVVQDDVVAMSVDRVAGRVTRSRVEGDAPKTSVVLNVTRRESS
jgi:hypothetical protein